MARRLKLAARHDGLADEAALLTAAIGTAADLIAVIADGWIRIQAGLSRKRRGHARIGFSLRGGRVAGQRDLLDLFEAHSFGGPGLRERCYGVELHLAFMPL